MEKQTLHKEQFSSVDVPSFLFDKIKSKIELNEKKASFQAKFLLSAAVITLLINIGVIGQQKLNSNTQAETEFNPYTTLNYSYYE